MEAAHGPWRWAAAASQSREGDAGSPGGSAAGPGALSANQSERTWSHRPWHSPRPRGREEEHEPRRDAAGEERR